MARIEVLEEPGLIGPDQYSVRVRFNYPSESRERGLTLRARDEAEFKRELEAAYNWFNPQRSIPSDEGDSIARIRRIE